MGIFHNGKRVILEAATNTAGEDGTLTSDWFNPGPYGCRMYVTVANGATGPTLPGYVKAQVACTTTGTAFDIGQEVYGNTSANGSVSNGDVYIEPGHRWARAYVGGNTDQDVTVTVEINPFTYGAGVS